MPHPTSTAEDGRSFRFASFALLLAQFIFIWTTFFVLSSAIDWPASLDDPASIALPRLLANEGSVLFGYGCYLLAALLIVPATAAINGRLGLGGPMAGFTLALACLSAIAKAIGISRWLFAMPNLARDYVAADEAGKAVIDTVFRTLNDHAGGIGEIIGVGLVSGVLTVVLGLVVAGRAERGSRFTGWFAAVAGASLFLSIPAGFGLELGPVLTISNIAWQFALLFLAIWALQSPAGKR